MTSFREKTDRVLEYLAAGLPLEAAARIAGVEVAHIPLEWHPKTVELRNYLFPPLVPMPP